MEHKLSKIERKFSAILFADIVGYSTIIQSNEKRGLENVQKFRWILEQEVPNHGGSIIQFYGDGCLAIFESSVNATICAHSIQRIFLETPTVPVRIGLHAGDIIILDGNIYGVDVNITSRIESMGIAGSVLLSSAFKAQVSEHEQFKFSRLGRFTFKNIKGDTSVYALIGEGLTIPEEISYGVRGSPPPVKQSKFISFFKVISVIVTIFFFGSRVDWNQLHSDIQLSELSTDQQTKYSAVEEVRYWSDHEPLNHFTAGTSQEE